MIFYNEIISGEEFDKLDAHAKLFYYYYSEGRYKINKWGIQANQELQNFTARTREK